RAAVPLRTAAEGPLSPVPPARRRSDRRGRTAGGRGTAGDGGPAAEGTGHRRRRDAAAEHAGRCGKPRGVANRVDRLLPRRAGRAERGFAGAAGKEPAAHPRQQGPARQGLRRGRAEDRRVPRCRSAGLLRQGDRRAGRGGRRSDARAGAGARPRLLPPHGVRIRHRPAGRARH
ncbi:hypothetical protein OY671_010545, partial [Metschnikowia pulcherrima]